MHKNSPRYNGAPHQKCHSTSCVEAQDTGVTRGSRIFSVVYSHCSAALSRAAVLGDRRLTQPRARHAGYIWALECHQEIVRISSLRVQSQSHLNLKDKHSPCAAFYRDLQGTRGVSGLSEHLKERS